MEKLKAIDGAPINVIDFIGSLNSYAEENPAAILQFKNLDVALVTVLISSLQQNLIEELGDFNKTKIINETDSLKMDEVKKLFPEGAKISNEILWQICSCNSIAILENLRDEYMEIVNFTTTE